MHLRLVKFTTFILNTHYCHILVCFNNLHTSMLDIGSYFLFCTFEFYTFTENISECTFVEINSHNLPVQFCWHILLCYLLNDILS